MDDFFDSLGGDFSTLAGAATIAGAGAIASDISGYNVTPSVLQKNGLSVTGAASSSVFILLLVVFAFYLFAERK